MVKYGKTYWGQQFLKALENIEYSNRLPRGRSYATNGSVRSISIDKNKNILIKYCYSKDNRPNKKKIVPQIIQKENLVIARWDTSSIKKKLENKFNVKGWFICIKNTDGVYTKIAFGNPVTFNRWIQDVKKGVIFFDSGMYQGNKRPYSQWRANNSSWNNLISKTY